MPSQAELFFGDVYPSFFQPLPNVYASYQAPVDFMGKTQQVAGITPPFALVRLA